MQLTVTIMAITCIYVVYLRMSAVLRRGDDAEAIEAAFQCEEEVCLSGVDGTDCAVGQDKVETFDSVASKAYLVRISFITQMSMIKTSYRTD